LLRGERDVVGAADTGLEHSAAPHRDVVVLADVVYFSGLAEPAHPANFDIHDAAGAGFDGRRGVARMPDRLVQTDGGFQFALQPGVIVDVFIPQRLLDHKKPEAIKFAQVLDLMEPIGGVGIAAQQNVRPARADPLKHVYVPARFYLHLDAAVAGSEFGINLVQQLFDGILNPDGDAALDFASCASEQ